MFNAEEQRAYEDAMGKDKSIIALTRDVELALQTQTDMTYGYSLVEAANFEPRKVILQAHGFLLDYNDVVEHLPADIHPLFAYKNFDKSLRVARAAWEAMAPAFTLATKLLISPTALDWWLQVAFGTVIVDPVSKKRRIDRGSIVNDEPTRARFARLLNDFASEVTFLWQPHIIPGTHRSAWGVMYTCQADFLEYIAKVRPLVPLDREFEPLSIKIGLSTAYLYHLVSPVAIARQTPDEQVRLHFLLAKTLVHELGHALVRYARGEKFMQGEPYVFADDFMPEVGASWTNWAFGVQFAPDYFYEAGIGMITAAKWSEFYGQLHLLYPVPTQWMQGWFCKEAWKAIEKGQYPHFVSFATPQYFLAHRYLSKKWAKRFNRTGWCWALYQNHVSGPARVILPALSVDSTAAFSTPPIGADIEEWYSELLVVDKAVSLDEGVPVPDSDSWGGYKHLRGNWAHAEDLVVLKTPLAEGK